VKALDRSMFEPLVRRELDADLGESGDVTGRAVVDPAVTGRGILVARRPGRLCGLEVALCAFDLVGEVRCRRLVGERSDVAAGVAVARVSGSARSIPAAKKAR